MSPPRKRGPMGTWIPACAGMTNYTLPPAAVAACGSLLQLGALLRGEQPDHLADRLGPQHGDFGVRLAGRVGQRAHVRARVDGRLAQRGVRGAVGLETLLEGAFLL